MIGAGDHRLAGLQRLAQRIQGLGRILRCYGANTPKRDQAFPGVAGSVGAGASASVLADPPAACGTSLLTIGSMK